MKRIISVVILVVSLCVLLPTTTFAAESSKCYLAELGMSISIPNDFAVFTRDVKASDPNLKLFGHTKESILSIMKNGSAYLNALHTNGTCEVVVTMLESPLENYTLLSDTTLTAIGSSFSDVYKESGVTMISSEVYQHHQAKFLKIRLQQTHEGRIVHSLQYNTVYGGKAINVTLHSYAGEIDAFDRLTLVAIVDSIKFDADPVLPEKAESTPAYTYTDSNTGTTFTVPENWVESPMFEEREVIDAKFTSNLEEGMSIIYTSEDFYGSEEVQNELTPEEKASIVRADVDNSILTKEVVETMVPGSSQNVNISMASYGGVEYFLVEMTASGTAYGMNVSMPSVWLIRLENGYMYMFQFSGGKDNPYFKDFESLLSSVTYPPVAPKTSLQQSGATDNTGFDVLVVVGVCALIFAMYWYSVKKKPATQKENVPTEPKQQYNVEQNKRELDVFEATKPCDEILCCSETTKESIMFCHKCGNKLMPGSLFCNKCGTEIQKG